MGSVSNQIAAKGFSSNKMLENNVTNYKWSIDVFRKSYCLILLKWNQTTSRLQSPSVLHHYVVQATMCLRFILVRRSTTSVRILQLERLPICTATVVSCAPYVVGVAWSRHRAGRRQSDRHDFHWWQDLRWMNNHHQPWQLSATSQAVSCTVFIIVSMICSFLVSWFGLSCNVDFCVCYIIVTDRSFLWNVEFWAESCDLPISTNHHLIGGGLLVDQDPPGWEW